MTIGMFTEVYSPTINGVVISVQTFANELRRRGHRVIIFAPAHPGAKSEKDVVRLPAWHLPGTKDYTFVTANLTDVLRVAQTLKLDLIHSHHIFRVGSYARSVARALGIPIIQTYHTLITEYTHYVPIFHTQLRQYLIYRSRSFLNSVDQVIAPSPSIERLLRSYGVTQPIAVNPTGIEPKLYHSPLTDKELMALHIDPKRPFILFVGRLAQEKNVGLLLRSFRQLSQVFPELQLVLVGGGPEATHYQDWINAHQLADRVILTGFLPPEQTHRIFGRATVFAFPSITDTQAIIILEAMAAGTPVVAVNKFGPADYITDGQTGRLTPNATAPFTHAIAELLSQKHTRTQLAKAARAVADHYSIRETTTRLLTIYASALKTKSAEIALPSSAKSTLLLD